MKTVCRAVTAVLLAGTLFCLPSTAFARNTEKERESVPPVLSDIWLETTTVFAGETLRVFADADDDDSGVKKLTATFTHERGGAVYTVTLFHGGEEEAEAFRGDLRIPREAPAGSYQLLRVVAEDRDGNRALYDSRGTPLPGSAVCFEVAAGSPPGGPQSCRVSRSGSLYRVSFRCTDADLEKATLLFENKENHHKYTISLDVDDLQTDGSYRAELPVSPYEPSGQFALSQVVIRNKAGYQRTWSATVPEDSDDLPLMIAAAFSVQGKQTDSVPPTLLALKVGDGQRDEKDEKTRYPLQLRARDDDSGIAHITVRFEDADSGESVSKVLRAADCKQGGFYSGELAVDFDRQPGVYRLYSVTLCDEAGNRITYCREADLTDNKRVLPMTAAVTVK